MKKIAVAFIVLYVLMYLFPIGHRPLFRPDETRYAEIAREMLAGGDWVVPKFNNLFYFEKPVMGHWLNAASLGMFGENQFAVRLSSALAAGLTALLLFFLVDRFSGRRNAVLASAVFLTCGLVYVVGTYAVLDSPVTLFITGSLVCFFFAYQERASAWRKILWLALFGALCGAAFLTKGFLGFVVPGIVIAPFLAWEKRWKDMFILPWVPLAFAALVALSWGVMIYHRAPDFWRYFIMVEHVQRFTGEVESQHPEGPWFFIPVLIGGAMPWIVLLPAVIKGVKGRFRKFFDDALIRYALCWTVLPFLFFSASSGKLATYILPCFPAVALLFASGLQAYFEDNPKPVIFNNCVKIFCWILGVAAVGFCVFQFITLCAPEAMRKVMVFRPGEIWKWIIAALTLCLYCGLLVAAYRAQTAARKLMFFALGPLPALFIYHFSVPEFVTEKNAPGAFLLEHAGRIKPETKIISYKNLVGDVCWYYKRNDVYIYHKAGELEYGISQPDAAHRLISREQFADEAKKQPRGNIVIIMNSKRLYRELPGESVKYDFSSGENYFREY